LYEEPQFDEDNNYIKQELNEENLKLKLELNLKEGLLKINTGIPIVFVINKSDIVHQTGERKRFEEDSEFILKHLRNTALICNKYIAYLFIFRRSDYYIYFYKAKHQFKYNLRIYFT
jgi:hypothetical protein